MSSSGKATGRQDLELSEHRRELLRLHREILHSQKHRILEFTGPNSSELEAYSREYERVFRCYEALGDKREVIEEAAAADIVFCGDYHTLEQAQKTSVRILRELVERRRVTLALEMVRARDQRRVDEFLAGHLDEATFLERIDYPRSWGFPWRNYRVFFDFAREHGLPVVGLNYRPPRRQPGKLLKRDAFAAQLLADLLQEEGGPLVWAVYGDLHLAPGHMPLQLEKILAARGQARRMLLLFQNNKQLWLHLSEQGLIPQVDTVRLAPGRYCILNTPPWIKLQTYLDHLERRIFTAEGDEESSLTYEEHVVQLVGELGRLLGTPHVEPERFHLYTSEDAEDAGELGELIREAGGRAELQLLLETRSSEYFPAAEVLYLREVDSNHAAQGAAEYLHHRVSGFSEEVRPPQDLFYLRCLRKCLGFFGSMLLNPKRKTDYFKDHELLLARLRRRRLAPREARLRAVSRLVVQHQRSVERLLSGGRGPPRLQRVYREDPRLGQGVSRSLGFIMGDKLHRALMEGLVDKAAVRRLFGAPLTRQGDAWELYLELRRTLKAVKKPFDSKEEFF